MVSENDQDAANAIQERYSDMIDSLEATLESEELASTHASLFNCSACKSAGYCSRACQASDWARHKPFCA